MTASANSTSVANVDLSTVLKPANETVSGNVAVVQPQQMKQSISIPAQGFITYNPKRINKISARFNGRIEHLYVRYNYQMINRGDKLLDIYSPDVSTAEDQLIQLLKNDSNNTSLIKSARQKLLLLDLSNEEIDKIIRQGHADQAISIYSPYSGHAHSMNEEMMKTDEQQNQFAVPDFNLREGMYVQAGQTLLSVYNTDEVWAIVFTDALNASLIKTKLPISIVIDDDTTNATIDYIEPLLSGNSKFITIRAYLKNESHRMDMNSSRFKIGQLLTATIQTEDTKGLWLPDDAIFNIGSHEVVWLKTENTFTAHEIKTGIKDKDFTQILDGLSGSDTVALNAGLLNDNDSFIRTKN